jgi:hypothetical protein
MIPQSDLKDVAIRYQRAGLSILPIRADGSKAPALKTWEPLQKRLPTEDEIREWFGNGARRGVAVVCGAVSGGLYALDLDDLTIGEAFITELLAYDSELLFAMPQCRTPRPGKRLFFRYDGELHSTVLAYRVDADGRKREAIALIGDGKYSIVPPTPAECHENRKPYEWVRGDLTSVPTLSDEQLEDILALARLFDEAPKPEPAPLRVTGEAQRVGDRFNQEGDVLELLQRHGWRVAGNGREGNIYLTRPGKPRGVSASWHPQLGTLYVFTTNAPPFEAGRAYSPFAVYTLLEHGGDFSAAAKALAKQYGNGHDSVVPQPAPRRAISLRELMEKQFEPLTYLVPDILPEGGLTLLVGRPKVGKSWFALQIACALSAGGFAFGLDTPLPKRRVLYCALEDGQRRLQRRITLLGAAYDPDAFHIVTELSPLDRGGADELRQLIQETQAQVVFVDVVARILPRRKRNDGVYQSDYDAFALLKDLAVAEGVTLVAVHHESKAPNEDPLMRVSGSTGLTGAVDAVLTLSKPRGEQMGTLFVTGRDIEREGEFAVTFTAGKWYVEGDAKTVRMSEERRSILQAISELGGKAKPTEIALVLGKSAGTVRFLLHKMTQAGEVQRANGYYTNTANTANALTLDANINTPANTANALTLSTQDTNVRTVSTVSTVSDVSTVSENTIEHITTIESPPNSKSVTVDDSESGSNSKAVTVDPEGDSDIPDYRTAVIPLREGVAAWCDTCGCSMLHVPTRAGDFECVDCGTRRRFPPQGG